MIEYYKLAYYNDEAGIDPASSKAIGSELGFCYTILRTVNNKSVIDLDDKRLIELKQEYNNIEIIGIHTPFTIREELSQSNFNNLHRKIFIMRPSFVRFGWNGENYNKDTINKIIDLSISLNFMPLIEYTHDHFTTPKYISVDAWLSLLDHSRRLKIQFDPVHYVYRMKIDPVIKIFIPLYQHIGLIDVRDYLIGVAPKMVGFGTIDWRTIFRHTHENKYNGWLGFEPNLGTRYNELTGRGEIFKSAYNVFKELLEESCQ